MPWHCVMCNPLHVNKLGLIGIGGGARGAGLHPMSIPDESVVPMSLGQGQGQGVLNSCDDDPWGNKVLREGLNKW